MKVEQKIYKGRYLVSSDGKIKRITKNGIVIDKKPTVSKQNNGYVRVTIHYKNEYLHRIVARVFLGEIDGFDVDHIDGNKENNNVSNLEIVTHKENVRRRDKRLGGSLYERAKHTRNKKNKYKWNNIFFKSQKEIAEHFGTTQSNISYYLKNNSKLKGIKIEKI
ncbi:HNH endonuclease [Lactococcus phage 4R15L]|nr:HNH endonuclease [Lactococcus phage 4R15L]